MFPYSFYETSITLISKQDKDITKKEKLQGNISHKYRCKNVPKMLAAIIQECQNKFYTL